MNGEIKNERLEIIELLMFITGRSIVFYQHMTLEQLRTEYQQLRSVEDI